jgi:hypothetical protein
MYEYNHLHCLPSSEVGEIDTALNFQPLTEAQKLQQSLSTIEAYRRRGSGVTHSRVREWADSLGETINLVSLNFQRI